MLDDQPCALAVTMDVTPVAEVPLDNFAVYIMWHVNEEALAQAFDKHLGVADLTSSLHNLPGMWGHPPPPTPRQPIMSAPTVPKPAYQVEYSTLISQPILNPALVGLVPPEPAIWSKTERIPKLVSR